jgi:hypothetical protein
MDWNETPKRFPDYGKEDPSIRNFQDLVVSRNPQRLYDKTPRVEEAYFESTHWLEYYMRNEFNDGKRFEGDGVLVTKADLEKLQTLIHKVIDSMEIKATRGRDEGMPHYEVLNPDSCDTSLLNSYIEEEFDDYYVWKIFRVNQAVDRILRDLPWNSRDLYYTST